MEFVNTHWGNPLRHEVDGDIVVEEELPEPLRSLEWNDMFYLCRVVTFSKITAGEGHTLTFPHLDGRVSIYVSQKSLCRADGMSSFVMDETMDEADADRIASAWDWMIANNRLYFDCDPIPAPVATAHLLEQPALAQRQDHPGRRLFPTSVLHQLDPGPRAADAPIENIQVGLDTHNDDLVTFSNPDLLPMLFPELYPYGHSAFALWHYKTKLARPEGAEDEDGGGPRFSIKVYSKYRLLHFDRTFARNKRFITFMEDWIIKNAVYGYRMRSTATTRGNARPTQCQDVLQGNE